TRLMHVELVVALDEDDACAGRGDAGERFGQRRVLGAEVCAAAETEVEDVAVQDEDPRVRGDALERVDEQRAAPFGERGQVDIRGDDQVAAYHGPRHAAPSSRVAIALWWSSRIRRFMWEALGTDSLGDESKYRPHHRLLPGRSPSPRAGHRLDMAGAGVTRARRSLPVP